MYSRSTLHLDRVASVGKVFFTQFLTVRGQVQSPTCKVPLLEKGHLKNTTNVKTPTLIDTHSLKHLIRTIGLIFGAYDTLN